MPDTLVPIARRKKPAWRRSPRLVRHAVMLFFFLFLLHVGYDHQVKGGGPRGSASVEAYCPFGGLESLYQFLTTGGFIRRIEPSAMILFAAFLLLTLIASRGFCGWICPFGSIQEWLGLFGRKLLGKRFNPTGRWDRFMRNLKYVILAAIIFFTWHTGTLVFRNYDPFLAFFHLGKGIDELPWAYGILGLVLAGSLWIERFFCKYACPLGAVLGIVGKIGLTKVQREPADCKSCNICQKKCYAHVDFLAVTTIRDADCNHCLDCVVACPKPNVLSARGSLWRLSRPVYAAMLIGGLFLLVGTSSIAGKWQTKPELVTLTNGKGKLDPESIRGWMTLEEIVIGFGIPRDILYRASGIPASVPASARLNAVAKTYKVAFEPEKLRDVVGAFLSGKQPVQTLPQPQSMGEEPEVKGFMTLNEIALKTGVPKEYLLQQMGIRDKVDARQPIREWMQSRGKSMQEVRDVIKGYRTRNPRLSRWHLAACVGS